MSENENSLIKREITEEKRQAIRQSQNYMSTKPLLDKYFTNILKIRGKMGWLETAYETFKNNCVDFYKKWTETIEISNLLRGLKTNVSYPTPEHEAMSKMLAFMGLVESVGVALADMLLILLIANGKEVHSRGRLIWHVNTFKELSDVDWEYKESFLLKEGFEIIKPILNLDKRNKIAHLHFKIGTGGEIRESGTGNNVIDIDSEINNFWDGIDTLIVLFEDLGFLKWLESTVSKKPS